jgi:hypothetical protein
MSGFPTDWEFMRQWERARALHRLNVPQQSRSLGNVEPPRGLFALGSSALLGGDGGPSWQQASRIAPLRQPVLLRSQNLLRRGGFDPNQPRVPAGNPDGGQWTYVAGYSARDLTEFSAASRPPRGGRFDEAPPQLTARLAEANRRYERARQQIRDKEWEPHTPSLTRPGSYYGSVLHAEARAREAEAKVREEARRFGIGGNYGPPLEPNMPRAGSSVPPLRGFDGPAYIDAYRSFIGGLICLGIRRGIPARARSRLRKSAGS